MVRQVGIDKVEYKLLADPEIVKPVFAAVAYAPSFSVENGSGGSFSVSLYADSEAAEWVPQLQGPTQKFEDGNQVMDKDGNPIFEQLPLLHQDGTPVLRRRRIAIKGFENVNIPISGKILQILQGQLLFPETKSSAYQLPEGMDHPSDPINWAYWVLSQIEPFSGGTAVMGE